MRLMRPPVAAPPIGLIIRLWCLSCRLANKLQRAGNINLTGANRATEARAVHLLCRGLDARMRSEVSADLAAAGVRFFVVTWVTTGARVQLAGLARRWRRLRPAQGLVLRRLYLVHRVQPGLPGVGS